MASFSLTNGIPFGQPSLENPAKIFVESGTGSVYVVDTEINSPTAPKYLLRKLSYQGAQVATFHLAPDGGTPPTAVDSIAFQLRGTPIYAYRKDDTFQLLKLATATVTVGDRYPINNLPKAGPVALGNQGDVLLEAVLSYDPDKTEKVNGSLYFAQSEEDKTPKALFSIPDPFAPTSAMAFSPSGDLYLLGSKNGSGLGVKRLKSDKTLEDVALPLSAIPDGFWIGPDGDLYLSTNGVANPAVVRRFDASGKPEGESEVRLKDGGFVSAIRGMAFDAQGHILMTVSGYDKDNQPLKSVIAF